MELAVTLQCNCPRTCNQKNQIRLQNVRSFGKASLFVTGMVNWLMSRREGGLLPETENQIGISFVTCWATEEATSRKFVGEIE